MLKIRTEQLEAFQDVAEKVFVRQLIEYIKEQYAEIAIQLPDCICTVKQIPDKIFCQIISNGIVRARQYGFEWESTLTAFVALMFVVAPNFDEHPLIQHTLVDTNLAQQQRLKVLMRRTSQENWEEAKRRYDANGWGLKMEEADR